MLCNQVDFDARILSKREPVQTQTESVILSVRTGFVLLHCRVSFGLENAVEFSKSSRAEIQCFSLFFVVGCSVVLLGMVRESSTNSDWKGLWQPYHSNPCNTTNKTSCSRGNI